MISEQNHKEAAHLDQYNLINHWVDKAQKHYEQKNKSGAKYWAEKVTKIDLENTLALNLLGRIALDDNRLDDACTLLNKALKKVPSDNTTLLNLGYTYLAMADYKRADDVFGIILECTPDHTNAMISVAYSQLLQGRFELALRHYRTLYRQGVNNPHIISGMADCCAQLVADSYLPELEQDLLSLYQYAALQDDHDKPLIKPEQLSALSNSLLVQKYQLNNPNSQIDIHILANDPLLITLLEYGEINCAAVESLAQAVRASILIEAHHSKTLNEQYLNIAHAISCQMAANGYLFDVSNDEKDALTLLIKDITSAMNNDYVPEDTAGALLLLSMYEPLYSQPFSSMIAKYDLADWPIGIQKVMNLHYYQVQARHIVRYDLNNRYGHENIAGQSKNNIEVFWQTLSPQGASSYIHSIQNELQNYHIAANKLYQPCRVLVIGCDAGLNALTLALNYPELSIVATESTDDGLAHAMLKAQEYELNNIEFRFGSLDTVIGKDSFDFIECGRYLNYLDEINTPLHQLLEALNSGGIIKVGLNKNVVDEEKDQLRKFIHARDLTPVHDHIRALRSAIIEDNQANNSWKETVNSTWFYKFDRFVDQIFTPQNSYTEDDVSHLCQLHDLSFIGFSQLMPQNAIDHTSMTLFASRFNNQDGDMIFIKPAVMI